MREDNENTFTLDACGLSLLLSFMLRFSGTVHNLSQGILMWSEANLSIAGGIWMNILIIGNGSDLAHGLPTTYKDFLKFGHSLDVTDRDIIREFILADRVQTTIFYVDRTDYGKKITNLVKVIGQDELIRRTGGKTKTITFQKITSVLAY